MRDIGPCLNPFEASLLIAGLETLSVRIERISSNALKLASWLEGSKVENIEWVHYPRKSLISMIRV
jgi:O-acetylhomoserine/O-acetylserine sulfhydrylase-like pyridoxal-dependent enzyme